MELHDSLVCLAKQGREGLLILQSQLSHPEGARRWHIDNHATSCADLAVLSAYPWKSSVSEWQAMVSRARPLSRFTLLSPILSAISLLPPHCCKSKDTMALLPFDLADRGWHTSPLTGSSRSGSGESERCLLSSESASRLTHIDKSIHKLAREEARAGRGARSPAPKCVTPRGEGAKEAPRR